ncbi:hypothetical protein ACQ9AN_24295, partial [Escherichia coli]|uniref:hypothetical protein n=1 Tax=Escherichia coli TaxID=562 RepID=UPI003D36B43E
LNGADFFFFSKHVLSPESPGNRPHPPYIDRVIRHGVNPFTIFPSEQPTTGDNQTLPVVCIHNPWH